MPPAAAKLKLSEINDIDKQIEILFECKPLTESEVKELCEKVKIMQNYNSRSN